MMNTVNRQNYFGVKGYTLNTSYDQQVEQRLFDGYHDNLGKLAGDAYQANYGSSLFGGLEEWTKLQLFKLQNPDDQMIDTATLKREYGERFNVDSPLTRRQADFIAERRERQREYEDMTTKYIGNAALGTASAFIGTVSADAPEVLIGLALELVTLGAATPLLAGRAATLAVVRNAPRIARQAALLASDTARAARATKLGAFASKPVVNAIGGTVAEAGISSAINAELITQTGVIKREDQGTFIAQNVLLSSALYGLGRAVGRALSGADNFVQEALSNTVQARAAQVNRLRERIAEANGLSYEALTTIAENGFDTGNADMSRVLSQRALGKEYLDAKVGDVEANPEKFNDALDRQFARRDALETALNEGTLDEFIVGKSMDEIKEAIYGVTEHHGHKLSRVLEALPEGVRNAVTESVNKDATDFAEYITRQVTTAQTIATGGRGAFAGELNMERDTMRNKMANGDIVGAATDAKVKYAKNVLFDKGEEGKIAGIKQLESEAKAEVLKQLRKSDTDLADLLGEDVAAAIGSTAELKAFLDVDEDVMMQTINCMTGIKGA